MNIDVESNSYERNEYLMIKMKHYLNIQVSGMIIYLFAFLSSFIFSSALIALIFIPLFMAIIFTPFMIFVLIKNRKQAWVYAFCVTVLIPSIVLLVAFELSPLIKVILLIEMGMAYLFYYVLRFAVIDWCEEINARKLRLMHQKKYEEKEALFDNYFDNRG